MSTPAAEQPTAAPEDEQAPTEQEAAPEDGMFLQEKAAEQPPSAAAAKPAEAASEKRDFADELKRQMTSAPSCLRPRPASSAPKSIDITLTAVVMPTGSVGRSEAMSGELDASEVACIRRAIEGARFEQPLENAPFSVSAVLHIDQAPAAAPAKPSGEAAPAAPPTPVAPAPATK